MLDVRKIRLILELRESGIVDSKVLSAIEKIPRENFIPDNFRNQAYENIALPLHINGVGRRKIKQLVNEALDLTELSHYSKKFPNELSGGEQQRVCIARAIVKNPDVILADEPTGNLDPTTGHRILKILEQINKEGTCVVMATHNYKLISDKAYRVIELNEGRVVSG